MGTVIDASEIPKETHLDTFKDIWGRPDHLLFRRPPEIFRYLQGYMGTKLAAAAELDHLDTFKDIWGPIDFGILFAIRHKFRYLQGYMGTPEPSKR